MIEVLLVISGLNVLIELYLMYRKLQTFIYTIDGKWYRKLTKNELERVRNIKENCVYNLRYSKRDSITSKDDQSNLYEKLDYAYTAYKWACRFEEDGVPLLSGGVRYIEKIIPEQFRDTYEGKALKPKEELKLVIDEIYINGQKEKVGYYVDDKGNIVGDMVQFEESHYPTPPTIN